MRFCLLTLLPAIVISLAACEKPCPKGQQPYGADCVMSPVRDAGMDAGNAGGNGKDGGTNTQDDGGLSSCVPPSCRPCEREPCQNGGICSETANGFECACKVGFSGRVCGVDACELDPCVNGECVRKGSGRECKCEAGYVGDACETNTDATLSNLTVSVGTLFPAFKPNVYQYSVDLGIGAPEFSLSATANVPEGATLKVDGSTEASGKASGLFSIALNATKTLTVSAEADDGSKVEYAVTVRRTLAEQSRARRATLVAGQMLGGGVEIYNGKGTALLGDLLAVGAPYADPGLSGSAVDAGCVVFFSRVSSAWSESDAKCSYVSGANLGFSMAMSEEWIVAGAPGETLTPASHGVASVRDRAGAVYVYKRTTNGLSEPQKIISPMPEDAAFFGFRVALVGSLLVVSEAVWKAVHVFDLASSGNKRVLSIPAPAGSRSFGTDIALEPPLVVIGAPGNGTEDSGAYIYELHGATATEVALLKHPNLSAMGSAVGISNGSVASASGWQCEGCAKIVVYERIGSDWIAGTPFGPGAGLAVPEPLEPHGFGWGGLIFQGNRILIGAAYESFGGQGINPDRGLGLERPVSGAAYAFVRSSTGWDMAAYFKPKASGDNEEAHMGAGLAMDGDGIAITAPGDDGQGAAQDSGAVYVFSPDCAMVPAGAGIPGC